MLESTTAIYCKIGSNRDSATGFAEVLQCLSTLAVKTHPLFLI